VIYVLVNFCTPWLAGFTRGRILPALEIGTTSSSQMEFFFSHLLQFSAVVGLFAGVLNGRPKHKIARLGWSVPAAILAYKLLTFSAGASVLESGSVPAFHYYFGGGFLIPEYRNWQEFWTIARSNPDMMRGLAQATYTAPLYTAVAYSAGILISIRTDLHRRVINKVMAWEERKFASTQ
jgi:hypothetical protein